MNQLIAILARSKEVEAASRPGRKSQELKQMKSFCDLFHTVLHSLLPENQVKLAEVQRSYGASSFGLTAALDLQEAIMKYLKRSATMQGDMADDVNPIIPEAVLHNLQKQLLPWRN